MQVLTALGGRWTMCFALTGLDAKADERVGSLSGGQRRRVDLALGIVGSPDLLFLDEPTTGFDPSARRLSWDLIEEMCAGGTTVLLTTHYLDEAEHLADRVGVMGDGRLLAEGTPRLVDRWDQRHVGQFSAATGDRGSGCGFDIQHSDGRGTFECPDGWSKRPSSTRRAWSTGSLAGP